ncbi:hypothetical protein PENARI_c010G03880 [Penicillium arizonense]|uniref:Nuclear distribution protein nudF n=1 Tax=Penicillium arizonense TaxID=1835702 RepID=A0A1F5LHL7_PENAI|nr:hypothetical protein PENARI_c010G03880 [Penicillium arizonense]OGE52409.1 hypothetical protein PENARI_c010G03880 [Penicillium arizonense]
MSQLLTPRQAGELHKAIIAYLSSINVKSTAILQGELFIDGTFDDATRKKYEGLLERKWTSIMRLNRRIQELEATNAKLETQLQSAVTVRSHHDSTNWLPDAQPRHALQSHRDGITCMAFHPVYSSLASGSEDCTIKIWDWEYGQLERTLKGHRRPVLGLEYGGPKDQIRLASCSSDLTIKIWDPSNEYANVRTLCGHDHSVSAVRFLTPNGNLLVSASRDASIRIWDMLTGYCVRTIDSQGEWIRDIAPSLDGRYVVSAGNDRAATIWEVSSGDAVARLLGHENKIECCVVAPAASLEYLAALVPKKSHEEGLFVATGSRDSTIKLWNERGQLIKTLAGHDTWIRGLAFHGKYLISVSDDNTIRCWDLSQDGRLVKTVRGTSTQFLSCIRWGPSLLRSGGTSHVLAIGSADSNVRVWM